MRLKRDFLTTIAMMGAILRKGEVQSHMPSGLSRARHIAEFGAY